MPMFDPAHPGELIRETIEGLREVTGKKFTIAEITKGLKTTRKTLAAIISSKQSITPEMALKLAKAFNTTAEFWMHAQENYDLALARKKTNVKEVKAFWKHRPAV